MHRLICFLNNGLINIRNFLLSKKKFENIFVFSLLFIIIFLSSSAMLEAKVINTNYFKIIIADELVKKGYDLVIESDTKIVKNGKYINFEILKIILLLDGAPVNNIKANSFSVQPKNIDKDGYVYFSDKDFVYIESFSLVDADGNKIYAQTDKTFIICASGVYTARYLENSSDFVDNKEISKLKAAMVFGPINNAGNYTFEIRSEKNNYYEIKNIYLNKGESYFWKYKREGITSGNYSWKLFDSMNKNDISLQGGFGLCLD